MKKFIILIILLAFTANIFAESNNLIAYYDSDIFKINFQTFGGIHLNYQGQSISTSWGIPKQYKDIFSEYSDVKWYIDRYSKKNLIGNILVLGGISAVIFGVLYPMITYSSDSYDDYYYDPYYDPYYDNGNQMNPEEMAIIFGIGGLISEIIGAVMLPSSIKDLTIGVNLYNRHKLTEFQQMLDTGATYQEIKELREENNDLKQLVSVPKSPHISFGVKAAVLDYSYRGSDWDLVVNFFPDIKNGLSLSYSVGVFAEFPISSQIFIQPEIKYTSASLRISDYSDWIQIMDNIIDVPLYVKFATPVSGGKFYGMAGPNIFLLFGDEKIKDSDGNRETASVSYLDNTLLWGFSIAAGYEKDVNNGTLILGLKYSNELTNMDNADEVFFHGFGAEIGYKFSNWKERLR